jgi:hypothetical protein
MFDLTKRPGRKLGRATAGVVSLAVVTTSMVALAAAGSADASPRAASARPDAARVQAVGSAVTSATSLLNQAQYTSKVTGTTSDGTNRKVTGTFTPGLAKVSDAGALRVRGTLRAVIHNANGSVVRKNKGYVWTTVTSPVGAPTSGAAAQRGAAAPNAALAPGACSVLDLVLGPLDLDLLGLQVHLDKVVLTIIAQSGAGNLLGNLLCAVAGLLDGTPLSGLLGQVADLLNSIFAILKA